MDVDEQLNLTVFVASSQEGRKLPPYLKEYSLAEIDLCL